MELIVKDDTICKVKFQKNKGKESVLISLIVGRVSLFFDFFNFQLP